MVVGSGVTTSGTLDTNGLAGLIVGYLFIFLLAIGIALKFQCWKCSHTDLFLAGRRLGYGIGAFTITATWIGGSIIHVTAGRVWSSEDGVLWVHAPIAFAFSLLIGGAFFAQRIRENLGCLTILDPIERHMGKFMAILIAVPMLISQVMWAATTFSSLSVTLAVLLDVETPVSLLLSALVVYIYSTVGGLYAVIITDIFQVIFIFIGLWVGFGFSESNPAVRSLSETANDPKNGWLGTQNIQADETLGRYFDSAFRYLFAGVTFQLYIQRVLCSRETKVPRVLSVVGAFLTLFFVLPGVLIGAVARSTDWSQTMYAGNLTNTDTDIDFRFVLPLVLRYVPPYGVGIFTLTLMATASLASVDAAIVSSSVLFTNNIFSPLRSLFVKKVPESRQMLIITRVTMGLVTVAAVLLALFVDPIYETWSFTVSWVYVTVFPQLLAVIFFQFSNGVGSFVGYFLGLVLLFLAGDDDIGLPAVTFYPWYEDDLRRQNFPYRTVLAFGSFFVIVVVSALTHLCYKTGIIPDCCNLSGPSDSVEQKAKSGVAHINPL